MILKMKVSNHFKMKKTLVSVAKEEANYVIVSILHFLFCINHLDVKAYYAKLRVDLLSIYVILDRNSPHILDSNGDTYSTYIFLNIFPF